ncbi:hypothetical protein HY636_03545 [Candidatus Woesearchaeota archaeon]|nr:hypothetical protein [Candidatus Woesearchaeota archaeon]
MLKNWKSATSYGVLLWLLIFVEVSVLMFMPALTGKELTQNILHMIILPVLVLFCAWMYFKNTPASAKDGFLLGVYFLVIGTVLDLLITIPLFVKTFDFYKEIWLWLGFLEVIVVCTLVGYFKK